MSVRSLLLTVSIFHFLVVSGVEAKKPGGKGGGPSYDVVKLDDADGTVEGFAYDINDSRLVVGVARDVSSDAQTACCWTVTKSKRTYQSTLHFLDGGGRAWGCNEMGEIVGSQEVSQGQAQAVYWPDRTASAVVLPAPPDGADYSAYAISNDGVICGASYPIPLEVASPLVWRVTPDGVSGPLTLTTLAPDPTGFDVVVANDVSDQDQSGVVTIVGRSNGNAVSWTVLLSGDGGLLPGPAYILSYDAEATATNNLGLATGSAAFAPKSAAAWIGGVPLVLDSDQLPYSAFPNDVNDSGLIVGSAGLVGEAVFWPSPNDAVISLGKFLKNSEFDSLKNAQAVNPSGDIVGYGRINDLNFHPAFLAIRK
jgi:hypothetical protein